MTAETQDKFAHIDNEVILRQADRPHIDLTGPEGGMLESGELDNGQKVYVIRKFHKNIESVPELAAVVAEATGLTPQQIHKLAEDNVKIDPAPTNATLLDLRNYAKEQKTKHVYIGPEGDKLVDDPSIAGGPVEYLMVKSARLDDGRVGEPTLVSMKHYGALKTISLPENNPGKQLNFEFTLVLKNRLNIVVPRSTETDGKFKRAKDWGYRLALDEGDAAFVPLGVARAVMSEHGPNQRTKYLYIGPQWGVENGASQKKVLWPEQIEI